MVESVDQLSDIRYKDVVIIPVDRSQPMDDIRGLRTTKVFLPLSDNITISMRSYWDSVISKSKRKTIQYIPDLNSKVRQGLICDVLFSKFCIIRRKKQENLARLLRGVFRDVTKQPLTYCIKDILKLLKK